MAITKEPFLAQVKRIKSTVESMCWDVDTVLEDSQLDVLAKANFSGLSMFLIEDQVVPMMDKLERFAYTLSLYDACLDNGIHFLRTMFTPQEQSLVHETKEVIRDAYSKYVCGLGVEIAEGFYRRLLLERTGDVEINSTESILIRYFGSTYPNAQNTIPDRTRLQDSIFALGLSIKRTSEGSSVAKVYESIPKESKKAAGQVIPEAEFEEVLQDVEVALNNIVKMFDLIIEERHLTGPFGADLIEWSYQKLEHIAIDIQSTFSQACWVLCCREAVLCSLDMRETLPSVSLDLQNQYGALLARIRKIRIDYIDDTATHYLTALITAFGGIGIHDLREVSPLNQMIFGYMYPHPFQLKTADCPACQEVVSLLRTVTAQIGPNPLVDALLHTIQPS